MAFLLVFFGLCLAWRFPDTAIWVGAVYLVFLVLRRRS